MTNNISIRMANSKDVDAIATVFSPSRRLISFLPELHTVEEDHWFIENVVLQECETLVLEADHTIVSFLALQDREVRLLHTHPDKIRNGYGRQLLNAAKTLRDGVLELWCFQENVLARQFYERYGFRAVEFTDGERNEEKTPDVLYRFEQKSSVDTDNQV